MAGRFYDDWTVGDTIVHEIRRTVTETDNLLFTVMTHNPQPLHLDAEAARALLDYAVAYGESEHGRVPFKQWPQGVKGHFITRTPPEGYVVE